MYVSVYVPTVSASTVPVVVTVISPDKSLAVAPASVYVEPNSTVTGLSPVTVITGAVVSTTLTVLEAVPVLPDASVDVYVSVYDPRASVSTDPEVITLTLPDKSLAVAPASVYVEPSSTVTGLAPFTVTTGAVVSTTLTVLVTGEDTLPELSTEL